jgi:uncharacterized protein YkwD
VGIVKAGVHDGAYRIFREWMDSPTHRAILMDPRATRLGCGHKVFRAGGRRLAAWVCEVRY